MHSKAPVLFFATLYFLAQNISGFSPKLKYSQQQCDIICTKSGGKTVFDDKTNMCKCSLTKNVDDTDVSLIHKNAEIMGIKLENVQPLGKRIVVIKRDIHHDKLHEAEANMERAASSRKAKLETHTDEKEESSAPLLEDGNSDLNTEGLVGQQNPNSKKLHQRIVGQRRRESRPISQEQQRHIVQQMRDHLSRLEQAHDQRARQIEIDALRTNVKQLSQTSIISQTQILQPQQRSRLRNVVEEARKRQNRRLNRVVGAPHDADGSVHEHDEHNTDERADENLKGLFHGKAHQRVEIITQDPSLIDD